MVLRVLVRGRLHRTRSVLIAENRVERLAETLELFDPHVSIYSARQTVMDCIVGFHIHRGILALGERSSAPTADQLLRSIKGSSVVVVLLGISNHDNMGGVFRNAAAFGAAAVLLDPACCDPLYRKAIRVSVGAALVTPYARLGAEDDPLDMMSRHGFETIALSPRGAMALADLKPPHRAALLVGTEGRGLPEDLLARASSVRIPMDGGFDSLNLATASGIALHHLIGGRQSGLSQEGAP